MKLFPNIFWPRSVALMYSLHSQYKKNLPFLNNTDIRRMWRGRTKQWAWQWVTGLGTESWIFCSDHTLIPCAQHIGNGHPAQNKILDKLCLCVHVCVCPCERERERGVLHSGTPTTERGETRHTVLCLCAWECMTIWVMCQRAAHTYNWSGRRDRLHLRWRQFILMTQTHTLSYGGSAAKWNRPGGAKVTMIVGDQFTRSIYCKMGAVAAKSTILWLI